MAGQQPTFPAAFSNRISPSTPRQHSHADSTPNLGHGLLPRLQPPPLHHHCHHTIKPDTPHQSKGSSQLPLSPTLSIDRLGFCSLTPMTTVKSYEK
ncbi:hypothetical protein HanPI659440_Chr07g0271761 [Helianthus annuus]|nr:hypothetical protein HanPI659440_Chr07g0271761 [Helianthus annuus]